MSIRFEVDGHVAIITLDRPEKMNAMDSEMYASISERMREIDVRDDVWIGVVTGSGDRAFTAGADLVGMHGTAEQAQVEWSAMRANRFDLGLEVQKPMIAAVNLRAASSSRWSATFVWPRTARSSAARR